MEASLDWARGIDAFLLQQQHRVSPSLHWLLLQTIYTGPGRRSLTARLPLVKGRPLGDLGTGFGAMAVELSHQFQAPVTGLDVNPECLGVARELAQQFPGAPVRFEKRDVTAMDAIAGGPFHALFARFLLQHLPDPDAAVAHWVKHIEPGGFLFLEDSDDGFVVQHPPAPPAWESLIDAFRRLQSARGGSRTVGRRLAHLAAGAGLAVRMLNVAPWVSFSRESWQDGAVQFELERVQNERDALIAGGFVTEQAFDAGVQAFSEAFPRQSFVSNATVQVLAQKR